jgi:U32 family peptidase
MPEDPHGPELLAPAGDHECLRAAVANGADAVFFGLERFNARMRADNFKEEELPDVVAFLHSRGVKAYVTLNVLVFTSELADAAAELRALHEAGVDAVIVQDVGVAMMAQRMFPDLRVHASTQMTITSPEGVDFAASLGIKQMVLARELSLRELARFPADIPLEVFVHGALCVAYSGQCLTSEALGRRSANRGECAQACRMPYELVVDGVLRDLGDRRHLLSPKDLAAISEIPRLIALGVRSFKIEGRLKSPEYVAAVTAAYRKAIDSAMEPAAAPPDEQDRYRLEMTFSRGLYTGWMHGVNHQELVGARFGKKRGPLVGRVVRTGRDEVVLDGMKVPLRKGDGIVFDTGGDTEHEQGGRIFDIEGPRIRLGRGRVETKAIPVGALVWKTSDPSLERELRATFSGRLPAREHRLPPLDPVFTGGPGEPLAVAAHGRTVVSRIPLCEARNRPLTPATLAAAFGKLADTGFRLGEVRNLTSGPVILPISELNRMRRELVEALRPPRMPRPPKTTLEEILPGWTPPSPAPPALSVLVRTQEQLAAALAAGVATIIADYEDIRRYKDAVALVRDHPGVSIFLAVPRILKAGEQGFLKLVAGASPDGILVRNIGAIRWFADSGLRLLGDFSLNVANPLAASVFMEHGLERVTVSHDLNAPQILDLARSAPPDWFEVVLHHHMPMFHMEHCVFAAFLSNGTDHTNCGRPCEKHRVHLRDRVGMEHPLRADVGCRNTLFHATPQSGASFFDDFLAAGIRSYRVELLEESATRTSAIIQAYLDLLAGRKHGRLLHQELAASNRMGVTTGTYAD